MHNTSASILSGSRKSSKLGPHNYPCREAQLREGRHKGHAHGNTHGHLHLQPGMPGAFKHPRACSLPLPPAGGPIPSHSFPTHIIPEKQMMCCQEQEAKKATVLFNIKGQKEKLLTPCPVFYSLYQYFPIPVLSKTGAPITSLRSLSLTSTLSLN